MVFVSDSVFKDRCPGNPGAGHDSGAAKLRQATPMRRRVQRLEELDAVLELANAVPRTVWGAECTRGPPHVKHFSWWLVRGLTTGRKPMKTQGISAAGARGVAPTEDRLR